MSTRVPWYLKPLPFTLSGQTQKKICDVHSKELTPPEPKRPRLEMASEGSMQPLNKKKECSSNVKNSWCDPDLLKERWILKKRESKFNAPNTQTNKKETKLTSRNEIVDTKERDSYKTFVLNTTGVYNTSKVLKEVVSNETATTSRKHALNEVICLDSDSEDDVKIIEPKTIVLDPDSSDSDDIKIVHRDFRKSSKHNKKGNNSFIDENAFQDLRIKDVIVTEDVVNIIDDSDVEEVLYLPQITAEQHNKVRKALSLPGHAQLITKFRITITQSSLICLRGIEWLNDSIINFYLKLIAERSENANSRLKVYPMDTFFMTKLLNEGHEGVSRWTRKVDIFSYDLILIPYNNGGVHWCLIVVDMRKKTISYYDSLGTSAERALEVVLRYLFDEYRDKKDKRLEVHQWTKINVKDVPQQMNGSDCGVFTCTIAEFLCRQSKLTFSQKDMPYFRKKITIEILEGKLLT